jgi:hypothetical protein
LHSASRLIHGVDFDMARIRLLHRAADDDNATK